MDHSLAAQMEVSSVMELPTSFQMNNSFGDQEEGTKLNA